MYNDELHSLHNPVMLNEVLHYLKPADGNTYIDCTFGAGGYSKAILNKADCYLYAIDCDPDVLAIAQELTIKYKKFQFILGKFSQIKTLIEEYGVDKIDGIVLDLGVSSMQLDNRSRGFSFMGEALLDMRMNKSGIDAKYIVNNLKEEELADIIYNFGEERYARRIAKKICDERINGEIISTIQLANIARSVQPRIYSKIDPATKTFQALRIYINQELEELRSIISIASELLNIGGKLIVVSFHSLEDKIVKEFIKSDSGKNQNISRYTPYIDKEEIISKFRSLTKKPIMPTKDEIAVNPRSRSAKLRVIEKL